MRARSCLYDSPISRNLGPSAVSTVVCGSSNAGDHVDGGDAGKSIAHWIIAGDELCIVGGHAEDPVPACEEVLEIGRHLERVTDEPGLADLDRAFSLFTRPPRSVNSSAASLSEIFAMSPSISRRCRSPVAVLICPESS